MNFYDWHNAFDGDDLAWELHLRERKKESNR